MRIIFTPEDIESLIISEVRLKYPLKDGITAEWIIDEQGEISGELEVDMGLPDGR